MQKGVEKLWRQTGHGERVMVVCGVHSKRHMSTIKYLPQTVGIEFCIQVCYFKNEKNLKHPIWRGSALPHYLERKLKGKEIPGTQNPACAFAQQPSVRTTPWVLCFLCFKNDSRGGIPWLSTRSFCLAGLEDLFYVRPLGWTHCFYTGGRTSSRAGRLLGEEAAPPDSSLGVTFIVLLGRKSNLKLLDSQELCRGRVCQPLQK